MTPWCDDLVCSWRRLLADRHSLPFPWTLSLHRRWCPSASHHPLTFLFLPALTFPLPSPFPSLGLFLRRPRCPSASPHPFPSLSLGRLCQRSPRTCPVSLLCVDSTQRRANAFAVGQVRPSGHPKPAVRYLSPTAAGGPWDGHLRGRFPGEGGGGGSGSRREGQCAAAGTDTNGGFPSEGVCRVRPLNKKCLPVVRSHNRQPPSHKQKPFPQYYTSSARCPFVPPSSGSLLFAWRVLTA